MVLNEAYNATTSLASLSNIGVIPITIIVFIIVGLLIFLVSYHFRKFIYGAIVSGVGLVIYLISHWIGKSTNEGNIVPITYFCYIAGFVIISVLLGWLLSKSKKIKELEKKIEGEK